MARLLQAVSAAVIVGLIRLLWATYRVEVRGQARIADLVDGGERMILTLWHDSIFALSPFLQSLADRGVGITYLVSPSRDGDLVVRILDRLGVRAVRGSATRSGVKALHGLYRAIVRDGASTVLLPDGPQGPPRNCKPGSLLLGQLSGAHVVPLACAASATWRLATWDRLRVPRPFARIIAVIGEPFTVPRETSSDELEVLRSRLEGELNELEAEIRR